MKLRVTVSVMEKRQQRSQPFVNWGKLSQLELDLFEEKLTTRLNSICIPPGTFHGSHVCLDDSHKCDIENYYNDILSAITYAESCLPKTDPRFHRSF